MAALVLLLTSLIPGAELDCSLRMVNSTLFVQLALKQSFCLLDLSILLWSELVCLLILMADPVPLCAAGLELISTLGLPELDCSLLQLVSTSSSRWRTLSFS